MDRVESMEDRADRLAEIACELRDRVQRGDVPEDTADWLVSVTDERDRFDLHFIQAAGQSRDWMKATAWARQRDAAFVDEVKVERAIRGEPVQLSRAERTEAIAKMTGRVSAREIARRVDLDMRQVARVQASLRRSA